MKDFVKHTNTENLLHKKIEALQAEVQAATEKEEELKAKIALLENYLSDEKVRVRGRDMEISALGLKHNELAREFAIYKEGSNKKMTELKEHYEKQGKIKELSMLAEIDKMEQVARQHKEQAGELKQVVNKKDRDYAELKDRHKNVVGKINDYLVNEEEERKKLTENHLREMKDIMFSHEREKVRHDNKLSALQKQITKLEELKSLLPLVDQLNATIKDKCNEIKNKDVEMATLQRAKNLLLDRLEMEQEKTSMGDAKITEAMEKMKSLEERTLQAEKEKECAQRVLQDTMAQNRLMREKLQHLEGQLRASGIESDSLKERVKQLETYQYRFKEDLQLCMSVINNPIHLRKRIIDLRGRYILNSNKAWSGETTEAADKLPKDSEKKKQEHSSAVKRTDGDQETRQEESAAEAANTYKRRTKHIHTKGQMLC